jgi:hypothetical protein
MAGFLKGLRDKSDVEFALKSAIKVATAKARNLTDSDKWLHVKRQIQVTVNSA